MRQFSLAQAGASNATGSGVVAPGVVPMQALILPYELRQKSRLVATLTTGEEVLVVLPRGTLLRGGTVLSDEAGQQLVVQAAAQPLSWVSCTEAHRLARLAYHLGNRHIPLQIEPHSLCYEQDSVLDDLVERLGGKPEHRMAPFEPESGAYGESPLLGHSHHAAGGASATP